MTKIDFTKLPIGTEVWYLGKVRGDIRPIVWRFVRFTDPYLEADE